MSIHGKPAARIPPSARSSYNVAMPELEEYLVDCVKCNTKVVAEPITATLSKYVDFPFEDNFYVVVQCKICYSSLLIAFPKEQDGHPNYNFRSAMTLWPAARREISPKVPESLRLEHAEARACYDNRSYTAAVVMVRRTLEGVCANKGVKKMPLFKALEHLKENGLIEGRLLEWAQELRVLGNEGAHFTGHRVSREDAQDALALAEALLDYLYVFNEQFVEFKSRRQKKMREQEKDNESDQGEDGAAITAH